MMPDAARSDATTRRGRGLLTLLLTFTLLVACGEQSSNQVNDPSQANVGSGNAALVASPGASADPSTPTAANATAPTASAEGTPQDTGTSTLGDPSAAASGTATPDIFANVEVDTHGGGKGNEARAVNKHDGELVTRGEVQLNRIGGDTVTPLNSANAYSSCTDCQTIAVALQINLISRAATHIAPKNVAVALNEHCTRCVTIAFALQYTYQVDDPKQTPKDVRDLVKEMDKTLSEISKEKGITLDEAANRIDAVIAQFQELAASLDNKRAADTADNGGTPTVRGTPGGAVLK